MAIWLFRAGKNGEYESKFLDDKRIYLTWDELDVNLTTFSTKEDLFQYMQNEYFGPEEKLGKVRNHTSQIWPIAHSIENGDWVVLPSKLKSSIHIGEVISDNTFDKALGSPYFHHRDVNWFAQDVPRSNFDQDLLYSMGAFMTVCRIARNDAESRIKAMANNGWKTTKAPTGVTGFIDLDSDEVDSAEAPDIEQFSFDTIASYIIRKFKGHEMSRLVEEILKAQGYTTYRSPAGPDKGVDILAAPGPLGFGTPKICIQVKTGDTPVDRPTLDQLIGTMQNFSADQGLLVSWSGFKSSIDKEVANQFFRVRLWDQKAIITELLASYEKLDEDLRSEIPLKRIWALAEGES